MGERGIFLVEEEIIVPSHNAGVLNTERQSLKLDAQVSAKQCYLGPPALAIRNESSDPFHTRGHAFVSDLSIRQP